MNELHHSLMNLKNDTTVAKPAIMAAIVNAVNQAGYTIVELNDTKPWGGYIRIDGADADRFVVEFFLGLTPQEARLGVDDAELSPKLLIVTPNHRLSWQYHDRRAERWAFLTNGAYRKSISDEEGGDIKAQAGDVVQFQKGERHRLVAMSDGYTIVAEIWQHSDKNNLSNEDDIKRLADDYQR